MPGEQDSYLGTASLYLSSAVRIMTCGLVIEVTSVKAVAYPKSLKFMMKLGPSKEQGIFLKSSEPCQAQQHFIFPYICFLLKFMLLLIWINQPLLTSLFVVRFLGNFEDQ